MIGLQPNSRDCFVCGLQNPFGLRLRFYQSRPNEVSAEAVIPAHFQGFPGIVHGGVVTAILDEAIGRAQMGVDPQASRFFYTARIDVRFRKSVPVEQPVHVHGRIERARATSVKAHATITDPSGELLAEAEGILVDIPSGKFEGVDLKEAGWKIYDPKTAVAEGRK